MAAPPPLHPPPPPGASRLDASYTVLHQDEHLLAVDKGAGLLTVPGRTIDKADSLLTRLVADGHLPRTAHAAHRLDRDTSGIVAFETLESAQVAPFMHGDEAHSSTSISQLNPACPGPQTHV